MFVQHLNVGLTAHAFKEKVSLEVPQSDEAGCVAHVGKKGPGLLLDNLWDAGPVVWLDLVEEQREQEVLHPICGKATAPCQMSLLEVQLSVQSLHNLKPQLVNYLFLDELSIEFAPEKLSHSWDSAQELLQAPI